MNTIRTNNRTLLHFNMSFIGGFIGAYAILIRNGNLGAAQTMNLIELFLNFADLNFTNAIIRLGLFISYGISFVTAYICSLYLPNYKYTIAIIIESICIFITGLLPLACNPLVALFPVFILSAYQWQTFTDSDCYNSSTVFSTNNYKQALLSWTNFIRDKNPADKKRALFFTYTLAIFHIGVFIGFFTVKYFSVKAIWITMFPIFLALFLIPNSN